MQTEPQPDGTELPELKGSQAPIHENNKFFFVMVLIGALAFTTGIPRKEPFLLIAGGLWILLFFGIRFAPGIIQVYSTAKKEVHEHLEKPDIRSD